MEIRKNGERLDLASDFSMEIEDTSPIFNDRGSQSVPATVPATKNNFRLMGGINRMDAGQNPNIPERSVDVIDGAYIRRGALNVTEAGRKEGFTFNVGFDNSEAYQKWENRKLTELRNLPVRGPGAGGVMYHTLESVYMGRRPSDERDEYQFEDLAVFPIAVNRDEKDNVEYWELLNTPNNSAYPLEQPRSVMRTINGERTEVKVPEQYGITPFLRVWKALQLVFEDLGLEVVSNPFREDRELERLVILNNTADTICRNEINFRDLMPDCTVKDFLEALWVRFGLVYHVNFDKGKAELKLLSNILGEQPGKSLDELATDYEFIRYLNPQYVKLSAGTSLEGAAPATERFEDFIDGLDVKDVKMGADIRGWKHLEGNQWDREQFDGYLDDREYPDPDDFDYPDPPDPDWDDDRDEDRDDNDDDDRDDGRDDDRDYYATRSGEPVMPMAETQGSTRATEEKTILAREFVTGQWYRLDTVNGVVSSSSTSFFDWDPQPERAEAFDLTSPDECVPLKKIWNRLEGNLRFEDYVPVFLTGARHFHTYIAGNDEEKDKKESTPLAFMLAYTSGGKTVGRLSPETASGTRIKLDDGSSPSLTLFFQFADGLFARYWKEFDEILRHGNREVEVPLRVPKTTLQSIDILKPVTLHDIRCLIDSMTYSLPSVQDLIAEAHLRIIQTLGEYDIAKEQGIPNFNVIRHLEWRLKEEVDLDAAGDSSAMRQKAAQNLLDSGFKPETGYEIVAAGAIFIDGQMSGLNWTNDPTLPEPLYSGQRYSKKYGAVFRYDVYECRKLENGTYQRKSEPVKRVSITGEYEALLVARWVPD